MGYRDLCDADTVLRFQCVFPWVQDKLDTLEIGIAIEKKKGENMKFFDEILNVFAGDLFSEKQKGFLLFFGLVALFFVFIVCYVLGLIGHDVIGH